MIKTENELVIRIKADDSATVEYVIDGVVTHKALSIIDIIQSLKQSWDRQNMVESGFLPQNCIAFSRYIEGGNRCYVLDFPERTSDIVYHNTEYDNFPLPRLIFGFMLSSEGRVMSVKIAVADEGTLTEDTKLFHYPFSNVNGFRMCTGANRFPAYKTMAALNNLPQYVLKLPNNDDQFWKRDNKLEFGYRELLEHLKDKSSAYYYTDVLIPSGKTLKDFVKEGLT